jgi:hypothetical protein
LPSAAIVRQKAGQDQHKKRKRWEEVAQQAVTEQDRDKFMALIRELNELLREKEERLGIISPEEG